MNTDTPNSAVPRDNTETPIARRGMATSWLGQLTGAITATMGAAQANFGIMAGRLNPFSGAAVRPDQPNRDRENQNITAATVTPATPIPAPAGAPPGAPIVARNTLLEQMNIVPVLGIALNKCATADKAMKVSRVRTPRQVPQGPLRRSTRILESARKPAVVVSVPKKTATGGLRGQIAMKPVIRAKSPILKPRARGGVAKKTTEGQLKDQLMANIKAMVEIEREKAPKEKQDVTTTTATAIMTETQLPTPSGVHPASIEPLNIAIGSAPLSGKSGRAPRTKTPRGGAQGPRRKSVRVTKSAQKSLAVGSAAQEGSAPVSTSPIAKGAVSAKVDVKPKSPILKPRAGAGVQKKTVEGVLVAAKAKVQMEGKKDITATTATTAASTQVQTPGPSPVHNASPKSPNITTNAAPSPLMLMEPKATDKDEKSPRPKTPPKKAQGPRRRSARITESARKPLAVGSAAQEGSALVTASPITKKAVAAKVDVKPESPVLKPRAGAGVKKETLERLLSALVAADAKVQAKGERKDNVTTTTTTAAPIQVPIPGPSSARRAISKLPNITMSSAPFSIMRTEPTAIDKAEKTPGAKTPRERPQAPRRRSAPITRSAQKSAQEGGRSIPAAPVIKKAEAGGDSKGQNSSQANVKDGAEKKGESMGPAIETMSPALVRGGTSKGCIRGGPSNVASGGQ